MTAGTTDERVDFYTHEAQLVNQGNTDAVYAVSPLGTEYELNDAGDLQKILPIAKDSYSGADSYQIIGERDGQRQLLKSSHFEEGVTPDVVVHDEGDKDYETIQEAINNIDDDTEREITTDSPGVIVVQKGVYKENIEVSDDITLIAEYGTVIEDANPNEDVVDIRGDNVRFQNFEVDGNPNPEDEDHYARHGINVQGSDAVIQGNTIYRANSPDVTSAAVRVNDKNTLVRYNNMRDSQQSINFGSNSVSPAVCGNQFEDGIGGSVTTQTQTDVATLNHWNGGMPSNLARTVIAAEQKESGGTDEDYTVPGEAPKSILENTNSRVDPSVLGEAAGQAALPFTGTKMGTSETPGECELSIGLVNDPEDGTSVNIEEIQVTINGQTTTIEVVQEVNLGSGESSDTRDGPTATCDCGGDGTYDPGDRISVSESSFGEIQTYTTEGVLEPLPFTEGEGSEPTPSSFNVQSSSGTSVQTTSYSSPAPKSTDDKNEDTSDDTEETTEPDFTILLGSSVDINLADEVVLEPVISGAESDPSDIQYEWSLGDGTTSTDRTVRHVYENPGTYTVELTVTDPATGDTDTDSTTVTVQEGTKDVEKISSDEQQRLADLVEEDPDGDGKVLYLEEGVTYTSLDTISAQDLTIIGQGDDVVLDGPITVTSSGVTMKNVAITNGLVVQNNDFKLYNSDVSNSNGYAVELNSNGGGFQIGDSMLTGKNGVYVGVDNDVLLSGNTIEATDQYGVYTEEDISNVRIRDNTITSGNIGIYESLAVDGEYKRNTITAPTTLEQQEATAPEVNDISVEFTTTDVPLALSTQVSDPDGYSIDEVTWEVNGETFTRHPSNDLIYTFDEPGEYTISVTVTDKFGLTTTKSKTVQVEEFEASLTTAEEASLNDDVTASVDYNIPEYRVHSIKYEWGNGEMDVVGSSSYTHAYSEMGDYDVTVTVNPDEGESRTATSSISIVDSPVADFAIEDPLYAGEPIQFNGAYSTAPDGRTLSYEWEMGDGTTYTKESPQHTYADTGTYTVTLTVTDSEGYTDTVSANLEVFGFSMDASGPSEIGDGQNAEFDVSTSIDSQYVDEYHIDVDPNDGTVDQSYTSEPFTYTFSETGEKNVDIYAISNGHAMKDTVSIDVLQSPSFDLTASETSISPETSVAFSAENVDATNPTYDWDFDDGNTATGKNVSNTFMESGVYSVELTVTGDNGISKSETVIISVASSSIVIDDFERGNISPYSGNTGYFSAQTNIVKEGSYALHGASNNEQIISSPGDGLNYYPVRGDTFEYNIRLSDASDGGQVIFGHKESTGAHYRVRHENEHNDLRLRMFDGSGNRVEIDSTNVDWNTDEWYRAVVEWGSPTMTVTLYDSTGTKVATLSGDDTSLDSGGVGFSTAASYAGSGVDVYWDGVRRVSSDSLVASWNFEDTQSTSTAVDNMNGYDGTVYGDPQYVSGGLDGYAMRFDGQDDYVELPNGITSSDDWTVSMWSKYHTSTDGWETALGFGDTDADAWEERIFMGSDGTYVVPESGASENMIDGRGDDKVGTWNHYVVTSDGETITIYMNGQVVATRTAAHIQEFSLDELVNKRLGSMYMRDNVGWREAYADTTVDKVEIHNKALTDSEVEKLYTTSK